MNGIIVSGANNGFSVRADDGSLVRCTLKGKKLKGAEGFYNPLAAGDLVEWEPASEGLGTINLLKPRRSLFWRYNEKGKSIQAIAANMDMVICVSSAGMPPFRPRFIDRVSLEPAAEGTPFLIVLNKIDLGIDEETKGRIADYERIGFCVLQTSIKTGQGIAELRTLIAGKTAAFVGQSGVGKSSLLNSIESGLGLKVGEVCEKYERGRHTTVAAILIELESGGTRVIDTPGFRRLAVRGINPASLGACFPEIKSVAISCHHGSKCKHVDEPGCGVISAITAGNVHPDRYESYLRILQELEDTQSYTKKQGRPRYAPPEAEYRDEYEEDA
jgi:ribosome biogenesis GTPase / thiamine phosphate phosphatase